MHYSTNGWGVPNLRSTTVYVKSIYMCHEIMIDDDKDFQLYKIE